jgi:hypothetical protein
MEKTFTYHSDPGHGWLEVTVEELKSVGLNISDISCCSFRSGNVLYLEEDCDAFKFTKAWKALGRPFNYDEEVEPRNDSFVRSLRSIYA